MGQGPSSGTASSHTFPRTALHCLRVQEDSPAYNAGIQPFFDYLIGVELLHRQASAGSEAYEEPVDLSLDPEELARVLDENEGKEIGLRVWNSKSQTIRSNIIASTITSRLVDAFMRSGRGIGTGMAYPRGLGRIAGGGLVPYGDYVVGWTEGPLYTESEFYDLVEQHVEKPLRLYVYSADLDNLREIVLVPNRHWGGEGLLGCGVGYGLLHRIPIPSDSMQASHSYLPSNSPAIGRTTTSNRQSPVKQKVDKGKGKAALSEEGYALTS
ncbi:hypothetical protein QFC21_004310 [Naganishia friedmannii]|uniref:Uncharacterized protein n=1 Tax=Naganishia friedmannii TaxID=89922 RepID=A0ACC2VHA2_9TREE|nr:hypothetical protein QFC21_004310 [Naganishia friedmannii]